MTTGHRLLGDLIDQAHPLPTVSGGSGHPTHLIGGDLIDDDHPLQVVEIGTSAVDAAYLVKGSPPISLPNAVQAQFSALDDVDTTGLADGNLVHWDNGAGRWKPVTLADLGDAISAAQHSGSAHILFTENGAGTYTATVVLPAGARADIALLSDHVWNAATSAVLDLVDGGGVHLFNALDLKAVVPAGQMVFPDIHAGALHAARGALFYPAGTTFTATVVTVGSGTLGVTHLFVDWDVPPTAVAAVQT